MEQRKEYKYMVATRCFTYNHAPYIEDALRGFAMQETTFPVVYIIVDDASTDGEPEVLRRWAKENLNCSESGEIWQGMPYGQLAVSTLKGKPLSTFVILLLAENHYSSKRSLLKFEYISEWYDNVKYQAICEGDDFWIDENKLQMQFEYMESHSGCSMCFHDVNTFSMYDDKYIKKFSLPSKDRDYVSRHLFTIGWLAPTASIFYRREWLIKAADYPKWTRIDGLGGDIMWQMFLSTKGYFHYIARKMSVYRFGVPGSATERGKRRKNQGHQAYLDFLDRSNRYLFSRKYTLLVWYKKVRFTFHKILH